MSTITNEPILLDSTGQEILGELKVQNGYLALLAEDKRSEMYDSISQIASIVRGGTVESNKKIFPVGDQIIIPWKDMDSNSHNTDETAYRMPFDIVHHGNVTLRSGNVVPGMFLQQHYSTVNSTQFDHQQAFMNCADGLAAGTYHVTFGATYGSKGATAGTSWQFVLTQAVPAGGRLSGFEGMDNKVPTEWRVMSWATPADAEPIETVTVESGTGGTSLGTMLLTSVSDDGLNSMQHVANGSGRWSTSAARQWLNSSGANWWTSQTDFDIRINQYDKKGYLTGFSEEFLNAIKPVRMTTALCNAESTESTTEDTYDKFFIPSLQQMNITPQLADAEGEYFEYWRLRLGLDTYALTGSANIYEGLKTFDINTSTSQAIRLRSAHRTTTAQSWYIHTNGYAYNYTATNSSRVAPVCVVC